MPAPHLVLTAAARRGRTGPRHPPSRRQPALVVAAAAAPPDGEGPIGRRGRLAAAATKAAKKQRRAAEAATIPARGTTIAAAVATAGRRGSSRGGAARATVAVGGGGDVVKVCTGRSCRRDGDSANVLAAFQAAAAGTEVAVRGCGCLGFCTGTGTAVRTGGTWHPSLRVDAVGGVLAAMTGAAGEAVAGGR